ncbi:thiamine-phosphate kinase [Nocardia implantans]|uniref:Thiamine-monophosphate kinase n=1 Tax=Nocardia implantans TaxID=3108168 RepID=A0ABU6AU85_9NOCA|nr:MULTISPECIES: thiamine-phosphate kinase [unclassified Nocardia]MBF6191067.1 thiamine-phosphate kinase [Nocardia beijingensis]MEA3529064.1 thiamine-phosphate kinase [Nocardia sp. CDC192]MEB3510729.1 thiamine-phosphate kinase [Nocardia sp. CDC186]
MRELGEFALIERINAGRVQAPGVLLGPGDDAALVAAPDGRFVVTTDMLVQDRHFRLDWSGPEDVGRKAIAQNAADVVAMGATPTAFVVALGCPADTPLEVIDGLADGMWAEAARAGASIAGGDLVRSRELVVSVTAFGDPGRGAPVTRAGARVGDVVAVAGRLGWSAAGLAAFTAGATGPEVAEALAAHRVPQPPYALVLDALGRGRQGGKKLSIAQRISPAETDAPDIGLHALTDVSDGLLADLGHIASSSGVAIDLDSAALRDPALESVAALLEADAAQWILTGGEDHAFAGVWAPGRALPPGWVAIGRVVAGRGLTVDGVAQTGDGGWESFRGADSSSGDRPR